MKKFTLILVSILYFVVVAMAQQPDDFFSKRSILKVNPYSLYNSEVELGYEYFFEDKRWSLGVLTTVSDRQINVGNKDGWEIMGQLKYYLDPIHLNIKSSFINTYSYHFYFGFYQNYSEYNIDYFTQAINDAPGQKVTNEVNAVEGGVMLGVQMQVAKRIIFDLYFGGGIKDTETISGNSDVLDNPIYGKNLLDPSYQGWKTRAGLHIGVAF